MPGAPLATPAPARIRLFEYLAVVLCFAAINVGSHFLQRVTIDHQWDGASYEELAQQAVDGSTLTTAAPFVYRIGWPWLVAQLSPHDITGGFRRLNVATCALGVVVLLWWLHAAGVGPPALRVLLVVLYMAVWQGPTRFVYFYAALVDPPLLLGLTGGLLLIRRLSARFTAFGLVLLAVVCFVGTICRESMILIPGCFLFVNNPIPLWRREPAGRVPRIARLAVPLAASIAAMVLVRLLVVPAVSHYSFGGAVVEMLRQKPLFTVVLGIFLTFGPIVAILAYNYRGTIAFLWQHQYLAAFLGADVLLSYIGGTDTERILLWSAPVTYVLLGRSLARHADVLSNKILLVVLIAGQAVSARVFWAVPDPARTGAELSSARDLGATIYGALDHLLGLHAFYFNLWSYFASAPWRLVQLALYAAGAVVILVLMRARPRTSGHSAQTINDAMMLR